MKMGHTTGTKTEKAGASNWYAEIERQNIQAVEDAERTLVTALATQVGNAVSAMPEAATRITKAAALTQKREIWPMSDGAWLVGSQSDTELAYLVTRGIGWSCECRDYLHRGTTCKHILAAMLTVKLGTQYTPSYN